jgi:hypothetical protein
MEYKGFYIWTYERRPEKWRARIRRAIGTPPRSAEYTTESDARTAAEALTMAMAAIDKGSILIRSKKETERFWRITARHASENR